MFDPALITDWSIAGQRGEDPVNPDQDHQRGQPNPQHVHVGAHPAELHGGGRDGPPQHTVHGGRGTRWVQHGLIDRLIDID